MEGREGPKGKSALLPPLSRTEQRGGRTAALSAGELGKGGGHGGLQKHEEVEGFRFPYYLGLGRSEAAAPRGPAGGRRRRLRQWRWGTGRRARGGGWSCGGDGLRKEPIYRRGKVVWRAGRAGKPNGELGGH